MTALNECTRRHFTATTRHKQNSPDMQNRKEGNDQESIQLSHTAHQRHQRERITNMK